MVVDELPKRGESLIKPDCGHVRQLNRLSVEYAGWVRIVGT